MAHLLCCLRRGQWSVCIKAFGGSMSRFLVSLICYSTIQTRNSSLILRSQVFNLRSSWNDWTPFIKFKLIKLVVDEVKYLFTKRNQSENHEVLVANEKQIMIEGKKRKKKKIGLPGRHHERLLACSLHDHILGFCLNNLFCCFLLWPYLMWAL